MKNSVAQYLLAAMAHDAAFIARDQGSEYDALVTFGRIAVSADRLAGLCDGESECPRETVRKIWRFLNRESFGAGEWYREALWSAIKGKPYQVPDHSTWCKDKFDVTYKELYDADPPNLGDT